MLYNHETYFKKISIFRSCIRFANYLNYTYNIDEDILCYMNVIVMYLHIYMMKNHALKLYIQSRTRYIYLQTSIFSYY